MRVKITLKPAARFQALKQREARGIETPDGFEGPEFENVKGWELNAVGILVDVGDTRYFYPIDTIARVAEYKEETPEA